MTLHPIVGDRTNGGRLMFSIITALCLMIMYLPLMRGSLVSSFVFAFLLSLNEYARAYYLVGRQNTLPSNRLRPAVPTCYDRRRHPWEGAPCSA
jgi:hypothetical protein